MHHVWRSLLPACTSRWHTQLSRRSSRPRPSGRCMLPLLPTQCIVAILPKPLAKPSRADSDERWDARKNKAATSASSSPRSTSADSIRSCNGRGSSRKSATSPPPKPSRADSVERWDAHKKAASPASSSSSSGSSKWPISRASSTERWDVHKKRYPPQAELFDDGESSSTGSNHIDTEEEILWKPRAMYAGPGFTAAAPEPSHANSVLGSCCILHEFIDRFRSQD